MLSEEFEFIKKYHNYAKKKQENIWSKFLKNQESKAKAAIFAN